MKELLNKHVRGFIFVGHVFAFFLMCTTAYFAMQIILHLLGGNHGPTVDALVPYAAVIIAGLITYAIDHQLFPALCLSWAYYYDEDKSRPKPERRAANSYMMLVAIRFALSGLMTLFSVVFISEQAKTPIDVKPVQEQAARVSSDATAALKSGQAAAQKLYDAELARADALVKNAKSGNSKFQEMYDSGNSWFFSGNAPASAQRYIAGIRQAEKQANIIRGEAGRKYEKMLAQAETQAASIQAAGEPILALGIGDVKRQESANWIKKALSSAGMWILDGISIVFLILLSRVVGSGSPEKIAELFPSEPELPDVIKQMFGAAYSGLVGVIGWAAAYMQLGSATLLEASASTTADAVVKMRGAAEVYADSQQGKGPRRNTATPGAQHQRNTATVERNTTATPGGGAQHSPTGSSMGEGQQTPKPNNGAGYSAGTPSPTPSATPESVAPQHQPQHRNTTATPQHRNTATLDGSGGGDSPEVAKLERELAGLKREREAAMSSARAHLAKANKYAGEGNLEAAKRRRANVLEQQEIAKALGQEIQGVQAKLEAAKK